MKFAGKWLRQYLDTDADTATLARALTALGLEIEGVHDSAAALGAFRVARVLSAARHPQADKLQVLSVDAGGDAPLQVVCGAPNAREGLIGVLGLPGAVVPANGMTLGKSAIRGVESHGMLCSARELGLGEAHDGIIELPADAPVGTSYADYLGADPVFDVAITPNRADCMGVYGIARDLAAAGLGTLRPLKAAPVAGTFACPVEIRTDDPAGCPAFYGRVIRGVRNGPSPAWLADALISAGQRPISALVDATNYVMLGYGRPAHAYDLARLTGAVVARKARAGECVRALNGRDYTLDPTMTVIADDAGVHDIAGIMGGDHSGCSDATTDVLLEVAYFDPDTIARTGTALGLTSDARARFERGVDPGFLGSGLDILTALILALCGGEASEVVRAGTPPLAQRLVAYDPALAARLGGIAVPQDEQRRILTALGFGVSGEGLWRVAVPGWRPDIAGPPDLVEEVIRVHGLDRVPSTPLPRAAGVARPTATAAQVLERRLRRAAAARGHHEAVTWSFLPQAAADHFADPDHAPWALANPISEDLKVMRPSLLPGLLLAARRNRDRGAAGLRLFEIGRRYLRGENGASAEAPSLALVLAGERAARDWASGKARAFDAFDAKAEALALLGEAGAPVDSLLVMGEAGAQFHPGQSATLRLGPKTVLARFGMLHPVTLRAFDLDGPVAAVELFLDRLPVRKGSGAFARPAYAPPALQAVTRDFAFVVALDRAAGDVVRAVRGADKANIVAVRVFDDFRGAGIPAGHRSLALEVTLQPQGSSYDEAALKAIADRIIAAAAKVGASLRG